MAQRAKAFDEKSSIFPGFVFSIRPCDPLPGTEMGAVGGIGIITLVPFSTFSAVADMGAVFLDNLPRYEQAPAQVALYLSLTRKSAQLCRSESQNYF